MSPHLSRALHDLHARGAVRLQGAPSTWSRWEHGLLVVLSVMVLLIPVAAVVAPILAALAGVEITGATIVGAGVVALIGVTMSLWLRAARRRRREYQGAERQPVTLDRHGLVLRGVGPIPWADLEPARREFVPSEHDTAHVRRAVLPLTPSGLTNVNDRLPAEARRRLGPGRGPRWNRRREFVYVPAVQGLDEGEVLDLLRAAHATFTPR